MSSGTIGSPLAPLGDEHGELFARFFDDGLAHKPAQGPKGDDPGGRCPGRPIARPWDRHTREAWVIRMPTMIVVRMPTFELQRLLSAAERRPSARFERVPRAIAHFGKLSTGMGRFSWQLRPRSSRASSPAATSLTPSPSTRPSSRPLRSSDRRWQAVSPHGSAPAAPCWRAPCSSSR